MKALSDEPITQDDVKEFIQAKSDFAFELRVLEKLTRMGFACEHSGTYTDPNTQKTREFDIRAEKFLDYGYRDRRLRICFAVECKNIGENFPLLFYCCQRRHEERFIDLAFRRPKSLVAGSSFKERNECPYSPTRPVAKSCDQIGRQKSDGKITGSDSSVFDKISQAINSSFGMVNHCYNTGFRDVPVISCVVPVLVVPDSRLWTVEYASDGSISGDPLAAQNVEYFVNKHFYFDRYDNFDVSHLEIVEFSALEDLLEKYRFLRHVDDIPLG